MTPDELVAAAKARGLDGVCLTEHQILWPEAEANELAERHRFSIFRGVEVTTTAGDILAFGLKNSVQGIPTPEELQALVDESGGFMILAHPFRGFLVFGFSELQMDIGQAAALPVMHRVGGLEVCNVRVTDEENRFAGKVADHLGLLKCAGSDAHAPDEVGSCVTIFPQHIQNEADLVSALKQGAFTIERWY